MKAAERNRLLRIAKLERLIEKFSQPIVSSSSDPSRQQRAETIRRRCVARYKKQLAKVKED